MSLGFEQAGFDVVLGIDSDGHHVAAHERNFPTGVTICRSVVGLGANEIYDAIGGKKEIDLIFGGPPCQGFSHMGVRDTKDPRNTLVDEFARIIGEVKPKAFVMENVPGMASGDTKPILDRVIATFKSHGYNVTGPVKVLNAADFGVPQKRKRLFLLGVRSDVAERIEYPEGPCAGQPDRPNVTQAICDLPPMEGRDDLLVANATPYNIKPKSLYAKVARGLVEDPSDYSHPRVWKASECVGCLRVNHTDKAIDVYNATRPGSTVPGHKLPRLDPEGICPTLRAGSDSAHGSHTAPRPIHPVEPRCITVREASRLHGFPDWFNVYPLKWHGYRQIGNAVCPPVARAVGREVMKAIGKTPHKPTVSIRLGNKFVLPDERPRQLKRIPVIDNYPPVVQFLFERATSRKPKQLQFTFEDVKVAIIDTGVNLSSTREDTFVSEIARSRSVLKILEPVMAKGYTLRALQGGKFIGEFVPLGEAGTVEQKDLVQVKSHEMASAIIIHADQRFDDRSAFLDLFDNKEVVEAIWLKKKIHIQMEESARDNSVVGYQVINGKGKVGSGGLVVSSFRNLPGKVRVARYAKQAETDEIVIVASVTNKHVLATRFESCLSTPCEVTRQIFEVVGTEPTLKAGRRNGKK